MRALEFVRFSDKFRLLSNPSISSIVIHSTCEKQNEHETTRKPRKVLIGQSKG